MAIITGKSFIAQLLCQSRGVVQPVDFVRSIDSAEGGWLIHGSDSDTPLRLRFDFVEHVGERHHYHVSAVAGTEEYGNAQVGISLNGYLGLYLKSEVSDYLKLELGDEDDDEQTDFIDFRLRDHRGYTVRSSVGTSGSFFFGLGGTRKVRFLRIEHGSPAIFRAQIQEYL